MEEIKLLDKALRKKMFTSDPYTFRIFATFSASEMLSLVITVTNSPNHLGPDLIFAAIGEIKNIIRSNEEMADWEPDILINKIWLDNTGHDLNWVPILFPAGATSIFNLDTPENTINNNCATLDFKEYNNRQAKQMIKLNKVVNFFNVHFKHQEDNDYNITLNASAEPGTVKLKDNQMLPTFIINVSAVANEKDKPHAVNYDVGRAMWRIKETLTETIKFFKEHSVVDPEKLHLSLTAHDQTSTYILNI